MNREFVKAVKHFWEHSETAKPEILFVRYKGEIYLTAEDHRSVIFFVNLNGKKCFAAVKSFVDVTIASREQIYDIPSERGQLVSCPESVKKTLPELREFIVETLERVLAKNGV